MVLKRLYVARCVSACGAPVQEGWEKLERPLVGWQGGWGRGHTACGKRYWDLHVLDLADRGLRGTLIAGFRVLRVITEIRESDFSVV